MFYKHFGQITPWRGSIPPPTTIFVVPFLQIKEIVFRDVSIVWPNALACHARDRGFKSHTSRQIRSKIMKLRDLKKMIDINDGSRTLLESIIVPELISVLKDLKTEKVGGVLIGGLALSYYVKPRYTSDIDLLFFSEDDIPSEIEGFKHNREHAFTHKETHVEVEVVTPKYLSIPNDIVKFVTDNAKIVDGIKIASKEGLILLKLQRKSLQDLADIEHLLKTGADLNKITKFLTDGDKQTIKKLQSEL